MSVFAKRHPKADDLPVHPNYAAPAVGVGQPHRCGAGGSIRPELRRGLGDFGDRRVLLADEMAGVSKLLGRS